MIDIKKEMIDIKKAGHQKRKKLFLRHNGSIFFVIFSKSSKIS